MAPACKSGKTALRGGLSGGDSLAYTGGAHHLRQRRAGWAYSGGIDDLVPGNTRAKIRVGGACERLS